MKNKKRELAIITTILEDWGGSEELWARSVPYLTDHGFNITIYKNKINRSNPGFEKLLKLGIRLVDLDKIKVPALALFLGRVKNRFLRITGVRLWADSYDVRSNLSYNFYLSRPDAVIISQGINFDGLGMGYICMDMKIPYILIAQKAVDFFWPDLEHRSSMRTVYQHAATCFFISRHNRILTEEQFGTRLTNAETIFNPVKMERVKIPMPSTVDGFRLACIGRYFLLDKGQDMLIRVMAMPKWKERPVTVSFIGAGNDRVCLEELAALLEVKNIEFAGHISDINQVWQTYHALILPSRSEGMPLVLLEAMACGRASIVTAIAGNVELITDGINGFSGHANETSLDEAMERAWARRADWDMLGDNALDFIKENVPACPEQEFAGSVNRLFSHETPDSPETGSCVIEEELVASAR